MLEFIDVPFKHKIALVFLQLFDCIAIGLTGIYLPWTTRRFPVINRSIRIKFDDSILHCCLGAKPLTAMPISVYLSPCKVNIFALQTSVNDDFLPIT